MIPLFKVHTPENLGRALEETFQSGFITEGAKSDEFESLFGKFIGNDNIHGQIWCSLISNQQPHLNMLAAFF